MSFVRDPAVGAAADLAGERIIATPPLDWELKFRTVNAELRFIEYAPPEGEGDSRAQQLIFEAFTADPMPAPLQALAGIAGNERNRCSDFETYNTFAGDENNYPTAVALMICRQEPDAESARISVVKTIQGNDYFYVVTRNHEVPAFGEPSSGNDQDTVDGVTSELSDIVGALSLYMRTVTLCDDAREEHPCTRSALDL